MVIYHRCQAPDNLDSLSGMDKNKALVTTRHLLELTTFRYSSGSYS